MAVEQDWLKKERRVYSTIDSHVTADALKSKIQSQRIYAALEMIGKAGWVLDVGANDCYITKMLEEQGNEAIAIDFPEVLAKSPVHVSKIGANANFLPFPTDSFDAVFLGELIEHIVELDPFIQELRRVLKPQGKLVITTPNVTRLRNRLELLRGQHTMGWFQHLEPIRHVRYYTHFTLADYLGKMGFEPRRLGRGESEGGVPDWSGITSEERDVIMRVINRMTPEPRDLFLGSFIVLESVKVG